MKVQLTPGMEEIVNCRLRAGQYSSASQVVEEALALLARRDAAREDIRAKIREGWDSAELGDLVDGEEFMEQMLTELREEIRHEEAEAAGQLAATK